MKRTTKKEKRDALLKALIELNEGPQDTEAAHGMADALLIEYINDPEIKAAYEAIEKWYA